MKKTLTSITLAVVLMFGTTFANAGIIITNGTTTPPACKETNTLGIIITNIAGIIITNIAGIIITNEKEQPCTDVSRDTTGIIITN